MIRRSAIAVAMLLLGASVTIDALDDWPQWRGPRRDGVSTERGLLKSWPNGGPPLAWKAAGAGEGYSSFAVSGGRLFTLGARAEREFVVAYDVATGKRLWETPHGGRFTNDRGDGPRSTPTVDGNRLYTFGASGDLTALDAASGKIAWTVNVIRDFGGQNINWGLSESPLVTGDRVIVSPGGRDASIVAVNKASGKLLWKSQGDRAGYSSAVLHGSAASIRLSSSPASGRWASTSRTAACCGATTASRTGSPNIATPIVRGDHVFLSSDYGTGAALLQLTAEGGAVNAREVYFTREMRNHHASSVLVADHLYGFSSAILTAMRFDTGEVAWQDRSVGKGSLVYADDRLYLFSEGGVVALAEATPEAYREHGRFSLEIGARPAGRIPSCRTGSCFSAIRTPYTPTTCGAGESAFGEIVNLRRFLAALTVLAAASATLGAEPHRGTIRGRVLDRSGAPSGGAAITVLEIETNTVRTAVADGDGQFSVALLPPGAYRLRVEATGRRTHVEEMRLEVNQELRADVLLEVGGADELVEVTAPEVPLRQDGAAQGAVIAGEQRHGIATRRPQLPRAALLVPGTAPSAPRVRGFGEG